MVNILDQPIQQNQRTIIVDVLRGWALLGVVLMNYYDFFTLGMDWQSFKPDTLTNTLIYGVSFIFAAKSWTLLSLLFGYGFAVLMNSLHEKGHNPYLFFAGRMFWLLVIAVINSAIFFGDILKDYAVLGLILLFFYKSNAKTAFIISIVLLCLIPAISAYVSRLPNPSQQDFIKIHPLYSSKNLWDVLWFGLKGTYLAEIISKPYLYTVHVVMFCCFLWGFCLYKTKFLIKLQENLKYVKKAVMISFMASIFIICFIEINNSEKWKVMQYYNLNFFAVLSSMLFIAASICWLFVAGKFLKFFSYLAVMGKMTLTNYMVQNLIGLIVFSGVGFGVWNTKPIWFYLLLALVVYITQIYFSKWWLSRYNYGPIEWVWRQLSYRKRLPLKQ